MIQKIKLLKIQNYSNKIINMDVKKINILPILNKEATNVFSPNLKNEINLDKKISDLIFHFSKVKLKEKKYNKIKVEKLPTMNKSERVNRLKEHLVFSKIKHEEEIMKLSSLKEANIYCVIHKLSAQQFGPLLEKYIRTKFHYIKNKAEKCIGDCYKDGKNVEVKVSLGGANHTKFNFVQIRPSHDCDIYILTAYYLSNVNVENEGELFIFKISKEDIKNVIMFYGGYAHGTIKEHGYITMESLNDKKSLKEYALRPIKNDDCWNTLMSFRIDETCL